MRKTKAKEFSAVQKVAQRRERGNLVHSIRDLLKPVGRIARANLQENKDGIFVLAELGCLRLRLVGTHRIVEAVL